MWEAVRWAEVRSEWGETGIRSVKPCCSGGGV